MSKINAVRIINLNYNNNAIRINDETFRLNGKSTLLSLRNGGGKSVLVQMMTAPFVHKRYRDSRDRPFASYFTTNKPTFILVEWVLDGGSGYVLTGMMVRKNQDVSEENNEELEIINFISEYREKCALDIDHLPVIEKTKKEMVLKGFAACRQMFDAWRRDRLVKFTSYDMNQAPQLRQYFDKLTEYRIYYKEWESIIKKVNLKESGLSDLFSDCRDEKGLVEKWFLEAVENKLNKDKNRMKEFENIVSKYVNQYKENKSKIERRDTIRLFDKESEEILKLAGEYDAETKRVASHENRIAAFIRELDRLEAAADGAGNDARGEITRLEEEIRRIGYEEISCEIHGYEDQQAFHARYRDMAGFERDSLDKECEGLTRKINLMECARWREETEAGLKEYRYADERLAALKRKKEDLEPERILLGQKLWAYYENVSESQEAEKKTLEESISGTGERIRTAKEREARYQEELLDSGKRMGGLEASVSEYDREEEQYNKRYGTGLRRNIVGEYEPAALENMAAELDKEKETAGRLLTGGKREADRLEEDLKALERSLEDTRKESVVTEAGQREKKRELERLEEELKERRIILRYLELPEEAGFDRERILAAIERKLKEIGLARRGFEKEVDELEREYRKLVEGRILELPDGFEEMLEQSGLRCVYGMEWLKKNGNSAEKNQELVRRQPFLPYSLILSQGELERLMKGQMELFTSFPVPIIKREDLETESPADGGGIVSLGKISFYVLFNDNLLDEEKLASLVKEKELQIGRKRQAAAQKEKEYQEYFEKQEKIKNQIVTEDLYEGLKAEIAALGAKLAKLDGKIKELSGKKSAALDRRQALQREIQGWERKLGQIERQAEDLQMLTGLYGKYLESREELAKLRDKKDGLTQDIARSKALRETLEAKVKSLEEERYLLRGRMNETEERRRIYHGYGEEAKEAVSGQKLLSHEEAISLEARYSAITGRISGEEKELEVNLQKALAVYRKNEEEFKRLLLKYRFKETECQGVWYSAGEKDRLEAMLEEKQKAKKQSERQWNEEDKAVALALRDKERCQKEMKKKFGEEVPVPCEEVTEVDFDVRRSRVLRLLEEARERLDIMEEKIRSYESNLTALSEYRSLDQTEEVIWETEIPFETMSSRQLGDFKGSMIRDYREAGNQKRERKDAVVGILNRVVRMEEFEEEFFKKPLERLLLLADDAGQIILQLTTILASYESLMEKLEVDISMVEKEKDKIVEILEDYVRDVHNNLGKIDRNSTITVRDRQIKMLKIGIPDWEENESLYHIRIMDFMDEITARAIELLEANVNASEYLGTKVTTKGLYDTVVGIGNVGIRIFKIEESREYPIAWSEVAKNSGGEGFLSAFIVLNSLLYYMRKDDTDLFADRTEGKVLLMDNPFAQTNASHLLKPLMDMAEKTDTQLICLSGLGGESIYNRFDNIYVLNLIAANLRSGMQYLKADHIRGSEEVTMILSQIEVEGQMELEF